VLGIRYEWNGRVTLALHNFSDQPAVVRVPGGGCETLANLLSQERSDADKAGHHTVELEPYGYRWLRAGEPERPISDATTRRA
jgi:maltose alpha-D-glucosyltransferase/alpha-amylase